MVARLAPMADYGVTFVSFQFYINLTLFLATECFRKVAQRRGQEQGVDRELLFRSALNVQQLLNYFKVAILIAAALSFQNRMLQEQWSSWSAGVYSDLSDPQFCERRHNPSRPSMIRRTLTA